MRLAVILAIGLCSLGTAWGLAANNPPTTAAGLDAEVHASWTQVPLRTWAARVSSIAGRPVILDRRIDPDRTVTLIARGEPLRAIVTQVAREVDAAVDELESTVRITPAPMAGKARVADEERRLQVAHTAPAVRRTLASAEAWSWPPAARPRDLVAELVAASGVEVEGVESIPHDHFAAADWPRLSLAERFDLVLAHFDQRVAWTTTASKPVGRIVPIDAEISPAAVERTRLPRARTPSDRVRTAKVRDEFTLRLEAPLDHALTAIARQLDLDLEVDRESLVAHGIALGELVRADVSNVSRNELFDAILHPIGLAWRIDGRRLHVFALAKASEAP